MAYLPLPFPQLADLGVISVIRLEEARLLELLAEGCMLCGRKGLRLFVLQSALLREALDEAIICERSSNFSVR